MGLISAIVNKVNCGASEQMGTGRKFCPMDINVPKVVVLIKKGLKIAPSKQFNLAYIQELQQQGKAVVLNGIVSFTDNTPTNETATRESTGIKYTTMKAPYELQFVFDNGLYFHKALDKFESSTQWDLLIFDVNNDLFGAQDRQGNFRGLDCVYMSVENYKIGKENAQMLNVQLSRSDFDNNVAWIVNESLDFTAEQDLDGYNDVEITLVAPTAGNNGINFSVKAISNNKFIPLNGLTINDLLATQDGGNDTLANLTVDGEGLYSAELAGTPILGNTVTLKLYDGILAANIINLDGTLYKSNVATTVVV